MHRRPERSEGEELLPTGRSEIQTKDTLQGKMERCSHRAVFRLERCIGKDYCVCVGRGEGEGGEQAGDQVFTVSDIEIQGE